MVALFFLKKRVAGPHESTVIPDLPKSSAQEYDHSFPWDAPTTKITASNSGAIGMLFFYSTESPKVIGVKPDNEAALVIFSDRVYSQLGFPTAHYRLADPKLADTVRSRVTNTPSRDVQGKSSTVQGLYSKIATRIGEFENPRRYPIMMMDFLVGKDIAETLKDSLEHSLLKDPDTFRQLGKLMALDLLTQNTDRFPLHRILGNLGGKFSATSNLGNIMLVKDPQTGKVTVYSIDSKIGAKPTDGSAYFDRTAAFLDLYFMRAEKTVPVTTSLSEDLKSAIQDHFSSRGIQLDEVHVKLLHEIFSKHVPPFMERELLLVLPDLLKDISPEMMGDSKAVEGKLIQDLSGFAKHILFDRFMDNCRNSPGQDSSIELGDEHRQALEKGFLEGLHELAGIQVEAFTPHLEGLESLPNAQTLPNYMQVTVTPLLDTLKHIDHEGVLGSSEA